MFVAIVHILQTRGLITEKTGATAIEYGLIAAGIAVVIITAVSTVGNNLKTMFNSIAGNIH